MKQSVRSAVLLLALAVPAAWVGGSVVAQQKDKDKDKGKTAAAATFELYKDSAGEFRFRLKDDEDTLLATSGKGYKTKADCQKVIDAIKRDAPKAKVDDQTAK